MSAEPSGPPPLAARVIMWMMRLVMVLSSGVFAIVVITSVGWRLSPSSSIDIFVYDQTVPDDRYANHAVLGQILDYHRVEYDVASDYVGAAPGGSHTHGTWPDRQPELIVLADAYGVYRNDPEDAGERRVTSEMSIDQARDVSEWVNNGVPAYGEVALTTAPTPSEVGTLLEDTFGFESAGWALRYVDELAAVSPQVQSMGAFPWPYSGPGILILATPTPDGSPSRPLIVLTEDLLKKSSPQIVGGPPGSVGGTARFRGWIEVVTPQPGTTVDAWFELPVTEAGADALAEHDVPQRFPALIRTDNTLYFSGNGLQDETLFRLRRLKGGATFTRLITGHEFRFFYQILEPSFSWLINQHEAAGR